MRPHTEGTKSWRNGHVLFGDPLVEKEGALCDLLNKELDKELWLKAAQAFEVLLMGL